jgi:hypothetical protein
MGQREYSGGSEYSTWNFPQQATDGQFSPSKYSFNPIDSPPGFMRFNNFKSCQTSIERKEKLMQDLHFLRPTLTKHIIQRLERGDSLNLYGKPGIGKTRLLEDIRKAKLPDTLVILVSFRGYQHSCAGFCRAIWAESELQGKPPASFNEMIEQIAEEGKQVFLLIDDFQYILKNPDIDADYNQDFVNALNAVRNMSGVSLLAVSNEPINNLILFINKEPRTSVLNLNPIKADDLLQADILTELNRRLNLSDEEKTLLASFLNDHEQNYDILKYIDTKIMTKADAALEFGKRLNRWHKSFKKERRPTRIKLALKLQRWIETWLPLMTAYNETAQNQQDFISLLEKHPDIIEALYKILNSTVNPSARDIQEVKSLLASLIENKKPETSQNLN